MRSLVVFDNDIRVEEHGLFSVDRLKEEVLGYNPQRNEFLPIDEFFIGNEMALKIRLLSAGNTFSAKVNEETVACAAMFIDHNNVFVGGYADERGINDMQIRLALLRAIESKSRTIGACSMSLYTTGFELSVISLYKKLGYFFTGDKKFINGVSFLKMMKTFDC